jgi:CspA family cold shock protein
MTFDKGRRGDRGGRGRDKRDGFGGDDNSFGGGGGFESSYGGGGGRAAIAAVAAVTAGAVTASAAVAAAIAAVAAAAVSVAAVAASAAAAAGSAAAVAGGGGGMPPQVVGEGKGVVKFFNGQKGFGFIVRDDGGEDVFVHISAVEQAGLTGLADGQPLGFTLVDRGGRISATDLKIEGEPMAVQERAPREDRGAGGGFGGAGRRRLRRRWRRGSSAAPADRRKGFRNRQILQRDEGLRLHQPRRRPA